MNQNRATTTILTLLLMAGVAVAAGAQQRDIPHQTEAEFQRLLPVTGPVETMAGTFQLDHSFPATGEADRIYDLMDHQRATQLYLWGLPIVGMTRWHLGYVRNYEDYDYNKLVAVKSFNERRGILTANETTDYFWGFGNTRECAVIVEVPPGIAVGMICDMWEQSPGDYGIFGPNDGKGDVVVVVGPNTPADQVPERNDERRFLRVSTDQCYWLFRLVGSAEDVEKLSTGIKIYNHGEEPEPVHIVAGQDKFTPEYQPRGIAYWEMLHTAINMEVVQDRDRFFMYWLRQLGIEKGRPFDPTPRQRRILEDGARTGELMAKTLVFDERMDGVLRQNGWRMILGGEWGDGQKYTNRMRYWDAFDPRARYTYEAITTSPAMTMPKPGKAQLYIGKFEDETGDRLQGERSYVIRVEKDVPAGLFWSVVIYDTDTRCIIDNRSGSAGGKATVGSKIAGLRTNPDGSFYVLLSPDAPPEGWEANHVQTLPGRGWFPYMRMYGAEAEAFDDTYKFPTITRVDDFATYTR